jgi:hypothetical protein
MSWALDVLNPAGLRIGASLEDWPGLQAKGFRLPPPCLETGSSADPILLDLLGCGLGDCVAALPAARALSGGGRQLLVACPPKMAFLFAGLSCRVLGAPPADFTGLRLDCLAALQQEMLYSYEQAPAAPLVCCAVEVLCETAGVPPAVPVLERLPRLPQPGRRPYVVLQPLSASACKDWPLDRWRALAARLTDRAEALVAVAHKEAVRWPGEITRSIEASLAGIPVEELAAHLAAADLVVAGDSLCFHLAAAVGTPCVGLFGPTDGAAMGRWYPAAHTIQALPDLPALSVGEVEAACLEELDDE